MCCVDFLCSSGLYGLSWLGGAGSCLCHPSGRSGHSVSLYRAWAVPLYRYPLPHLSFLSGNRGSFVFRRLLFYPQRRADCVGTVGFQSFQGGGAVGVPALSHSNQPDFVCGRTDGNSGAGLLQPDPQLSHLHHVCPVRLQRLLPL